MAKKLFQIYNFYGKYSGEELRDSVVLEDTRENREDLFDEHLSYSDFSERDKENFLSGKADYFSGDLSGGDWDDPTGVEVAVLSKEEAINRANKAYQKELNKIENLFK